MKYIIDSGGQKRQAILCTCKGCNKEFLKDKRFVKINSRDYCSRECFCKSTSNSHILICSCCKNTFVRMNKDLKNSKSGLYFCSVDCKNKGQLIDSGIKEIQPKHYKNGKSTYRQKALNHYDNKCSVCGYSVIEVLEVHHKDHNRDNNKIENLNVLCPNHHKEYQLGIRKYGQLV